MGRFLIDTMPIDAVYLPRDKFVNDLDEQALMNSIQIVDTRLTLEDIKNIEAPDYSFNNYHRRFFEIKDKIESDKRAECLHSLSLFKMKGDQSTTGKTFDDYVNGLRFWIELCEKQDSHKLRVYVGNSAWEDLHNAGILERRDVDFIRMSDDSSYTEIGTYWRFLAFDDYDYDYVWIRDTDGAGRLIHDEWQVNPDSISIVHYNLQKEQVADVHFRTEMLPMPPAERRDGSMPTTFPLLFWADDYRLSYPLHIHRFSEYIQSTSPSLFRGKMRLPFQNIANVFCHFFSLGTERICYRDGGWTNVRERHPNLNSRYIDEMWLFHLTRVLQVRWILCHDLLPIHKEWTEYGDDWFFRRLCDDLRADGNYFVLQFINDNKGYVFDLPPPKIIEGEKKQAELDWFSVYEKFFLVDKKNGSFGDDWEYTHIDRHVSLEKHKSENGYNDFINRVQAVDTRWDEDDLERITETPTWTRAAEMFLIDEKIESKKRGEALCSICLFYQETLPWVAAPRQAFSDYVNGLRKRIEIYRTELKNQKLRVYVGKTAWDMIHKEGILEADDVDFFRMKHDSDSCNIGMLWRQLAFDDYDYEYVYLEDTDLRRDGDNNLIEELRVTKEILERMFSTGNSGVDPHIVSSLSFDQDMDATLFYEAMTDKDVNQKNETLWCMFSPANYYKSHILTMARGPKRLPFDNIVPILCEVLFNTSDNYQIIDAGNRTISMVRDYLPAVQSCELGETWVFYMSKLMDIKMWVEPQHYNWVRRAMKKYGEKCFWKRLQDQMILDGNYLACGDQGVEPFSYEEFLQ